MRVGEGRGEKATFPLTSFFGQRVRQSDFSLLTQTHGSSSTFRRLSAASSLSLLCGPCPQISCLFLTPLTSSIPNFWLGSQSHLSLLYQMPSSADGFKLSALLFLNSTHIFLIDLLLFISSLLMKRVEMVEMLIWRIFYQKKEKLGNTFLFTFCITWSSSRLQTVCRMSPGLSFLARIQCGSFLRNPLCHFQPDLRPLWPQDHPLETGSYTKL